MRRSQKVMATVAAASSVAIAGGALVVWPPAPAVPVSVNARPHTVGRTSLSPGTLASLKALGIQEQQLAQAIAAAHKNLSTSITAEAAKLAAADRTLAAQRSSLAQSAAQISARQQALNGQAAQLASQAAAIRAAGAQLAAQRSAAAAAPTPAPVFHAVTGASGAHHDDVGGGGSDH
ncbi:MAG: hypothetical protein M0Z87_11370 [Actinomycetota bacterium]|nr:hypothetical protein [Actinomycetota bacterium]